MIDEIDGVNYPGWDPGPAPIPGSFWAKWTHILPFLDGIGW